MVQLCLSHTLAGAGKNGAIFFPQITTYWAAYENFFADTYSVRRRTQHPRSIRRADKNTCNSRVTSIFPQCETRHDLHLTKNFLAGKTDRYSNHQEKFAKVETVSPLIRAAGITL
jgi:hypothetical protein